jgi:hypothetical protein
MQRFCELRKPRRGWTTILLRFMFVTFLSFRGRTMRSRVYIIRH